MILLILFIILSYPFLIKYNYVAHNQYEQIPLILRYLNPSFLKNDWAINTFFASSSRLFFTQYIGIWARFLPLPFVYLIHYLFITTLVLLSTYFLSIYFFKSKFAAILTVIFILYGGAITLGGNDLIGRDFDPPRFAFSLAVAGITLFIYKKYYLAALVFGLTTYIHPLIGFEVPIVVFFAKLLSYKLNSHSRVYPENSSEFLWENANPHLLKSLLLFFIIVSFSIFTYSNTTLSASNQISSEILVTLLTFVRSPHHYLASSWPLINYLKFAALLSCLFLFLNVVKKEKNFIYLTCGIILSLCIISFVFTEVIPFYPIVLAQFYRLTVIIFWFAAIIVYGSCFSFFITKNKVTNRSLTYMLPLFPFLLAFPPSLIQFGPTTLIYILSSVFIGLTIRFVFNNKIIQKVIIIITLLIIAFTYRHYPFHFTQLYPQKTNEIEVADWAKNNTEKDAIFLVPPDFYAFRLNSERAVVVDWLVVPVEKGSLVEWRKRIKDISNLNAISDTELNEQKVKDGYKNLESDYVEKLKQKYSFSYIITQKNSYPLSIVYEHANWVVYKI